MLPAKLSIETLLDPTSHAGAWNYGIVQRGFYHAQLARFLEYYQRSQILVLYQETDVAENPRQGLEKLCSFLGLCRSFQFEEISKSENKVRSTIVGAYLRSRTTGLPLRLVRAFDRHILRKLPLSPHISYPSPSNSLLEKLRGLYEDDIRLLDQDFGPVPDTWRR